MICLPFSSFASATTSHISFSYAARQRMQNRARLLKQYQTHLKKQASYIVEGNAESKRALRQHNREQIKQHPEWFPAPLKASDRRWQALAENNHFLSSDHLHNITEVAIHRLEQQLGKPYVWGGSTGAQSAFSVSVTGHDASNDSASAPVATDVSSAQDAIIHLGSATGPEITNSSNTFDDVIPGVTMTFTEVSDSDSDLTTFNISEDSSASQEKVQTFVDAYNTLIDTVDSLTTHGDDSTSAGVFAGDAGLNSLANQLDDIAHANYNGVSIVDYGITLDSHGHLQIDSDQFNDEMAKNPDGLTSIFVGDNSMVAQMDDLINTYTDSSNGIITLRQQNIDDQMSKIQDEGDQLTDTYNANYDRYLEEYTNTLVEVYTMKASMAAFA